MQTEPKKCRLALAPRYINCNMAAAPSYTFGSSCTECIEGKQKQDLKGSDRILIGSVNPIYNIEARRSQYVYSTIWTLSHCTIFRREDAYKFWAIFTIFDRIVDVCKTNISISWDFHDCMAR